MPRPPQVSVVIPTHNRSAMLRQSLRSALDQEGVELEAIVVDDGSADDTPQMLAGIEDERLVVVRHERPQGAGRARNAAIERARGEWIAFLDDDDLWAPGKLRTQLDSSEEVGLSFSYSGAVVVDQSMAPMRIMSPPPGEGLAEALFGGNVIVTPSVVVLRAEVLDRTGGFDESLSALADWDMWIRAVSAGRAGPIQQPLAAYRMHGQNMSQADALADFEVLRAKHADAAREAGVDFGDAWLDRMASADPRPSRRLTAAGRYLRRAVRERNRRDVAWAMIALGGQRADRLAGRIVARRTERPGWLDRYA